MKKLKALSKKVWDIGCMAVAAVLSAVFVLSLILFFTNNFLVYEPLYNLLLLIGLLLAMILYVLAKAFDGTKWKRNWLMLATVLNFIAVMLIFLSLLGLTA